MGMTTAVQESLTKTITQDAAFSEAQVWVSLHSANPGGSGANELTNGTGAEARQRPTFSGSGGTDTNTGALSFVFSGSGTVTWIGYWTAQTSGTFLGGFPLVSTQETAVAISGTASIACPAHARSVNDPVRLYTIPGASSSVPTGFTTDVVYYVVSVPDSAHLTLSATMGGGAITPSSSGGFTLALDLSVTFPGTLTMPSSTGLTYATLS